ncbi:hypothetical protein EYF80_002446 [Liparis tanakae]|uniref:Uncharacterized protein n=1 Tax=Liparis tanakae TaxID=230148 RepID=A0A4Z2JBN3_9TELE|nr:hypothetical protein EYF80_002446 [Liparis tanakae]
MVHFLTSTFVGDGHFERYADDSHEVLSRHQRAQDGTDTQSFPFPLVDELKKGKGELTPCTEPGRSRAGVSEILMASFMAASRPFPPSPLRADHGATKSHLVQIGLLQSQGQAVVVHHRGSSHVQRSGAPHRRGSYDTKHFILLCFP